MKRRFEMKVFRTLVRLAGSAGFAAVAVAVWALPALATPPANCDSDADAQLAVVYSGATSINTTLNNVIASLCIVDTDGDGTRGVVTEGGAPGAPNADFVRQTCNSGANQSFECMMDLTGDGTAETCVAYYIHNQSGSCEGVDSIDTDGPASAICRISDGASVASNTLLDPSRGKAGTTCAANKPLLVEHDGSDVPVSECLPPPVHAFTTNRVAVDPFTFIVNQNVLSRLAPGVKIRDIGFNEDIAKSTWGTRDTCDWQIVDPRVTTAVAIDAVKRNPKSGTRRANDKTVLKDVIVSPDILETAGTGSMIAAVNNNTLPAPFNCAISGAPTIAAGYIGVDKFTINNNGTPSDPTDDFPVRTSGTGNCDAGGDCYEAIRYNGEIFTPYNVACGRYTYWTYLVFNRRPDAICDPAKATLMNKIENAFVNVASQDKALVGLNDMRVKRDVDGGIIKPIPGAPPCAP